MWYLRKICITIHHERPTLYSESGHFAHRTIPWTTRVCTHISTITPMVVFPLHLCQCFLVMVIDPYETHMGLGNIFLWSQQLMFLVVSSELSLSSLRLSGFWVEDWHFYQDCKWEPGIQGWKWISCTAEPSASNHPARCFSIWSWQSELGIEPEFGLISILKSLMECWGGAIP